MTHDSTGLDEQLPFARRNVYLLAAAQALLASAPPIVFSAGGIVGYSLLGPDKSLTTAPLTGFNIGTAIGIVVIAILARLFGRKTSFMIGALVTASGGALAAIALFLSSFWLFAAGLMLVGVGGGFVQKIRFAAADASPSFFKSRAISLILAGGVVSAVLGPQLVILAKDMFAPVQFAGAFIALIPLSLVALAIFAFLRLPELRPTNGHDAAQTPRPLKDIVLRRRFMTGMICGVASYAIMTFLMTGAPVAMVNDCGFSSDLATLGIQWHVLAMFAPSFFTGMLIARFGAEKIVAAGLVLLMACAAVAHAGLALWNFWGALILLGVGWNFGFIGATSIVASSYRPAEADKVQGFHDIFLFGFVALSSFASGKVLTAYGWNALNLVVWPVTLVCLLLVVIELKTQKHKADIAAA